MHQCGAQPSIGPDHGWQEFYGSTRVAYAFGHVFADCRDRAGEYCGRYRVCYEFDSGYDACMHECIEEVDLMTSRLNNAETRCMLLASAPPTPVPSIVPTQATEQVCRLEEEVIALT